MKRKYKLSYIYSKCGKLYEEELSFDKFYESFSNCISEYEFNFENLTIYLAYHSECYNKEKNIIYELNIVDEHDNTKNYNFLNVDDLLSAKIIDGHSLLDIWAYLTN